MAIRLVDEMNKARAWPWEAEHGEIQMLRGKTCARGKSGKVHEYQKVQHIQIRGG